MKKISLTRKIFFYYLPALFWLGLISYLSSFHDLKTGTVYVFWEIVLRKLAHAGEFAVLGFLFFRIFFHVHKWSIQKSFWSSVGLVLILGGADEGHQFFVPGREAKFMDVIFDVLGAYGGLYVLTGFKKEISSRIFWAIIGVLFFGLILFKAWESVLVYGELMGQENGRTVFQESHQSKKVEVASEIEAGKGDETFSPPEKFFIQVPFTPQAPFANWDEYHEEACEEASIIMLEYFQKKKTLSKEVAEKEILALIEYQKKNRGDFRDSNANEIKKLAKDFYNLELEVVYDFKKEDLKNKLSSGSPIIVPAAGRELKNPNFKSPGPLYHNLVIVGYDGNTIITNDPGTRKGEGYKYNLDVLYAAIHDFPGKKEDIDNGRKAMLVFP